MEPTSYRPTYVYISQHREGGMVKEGSLSLVLHVRFISGLKAMLCGRVINIIVFPFTSKAKTTQGSQWLENASPFHSLSPEHLLDSGFCIGNEGSCYKHG